MVGSCVLSVCTRYIIIFQPGQTHGTLLLFWVAPGICTVVIEQDDRALTFSRTLQLSGLQNLDSGRAFS